LAARDLFFHAFEVVAGLIFHRSMWVGLATFAF